MDIGVKRLAAASSTSSWGVPGGPEAIWFSEGALKKVGGILKERGGVARNPPSERFSLAEESTGVTGVWRGRPYRAALRVPEREQCYL